VTETTRRNDMLVELDRGEMKLLMGAVAEKSDRLRTALKSLRTDSGEIRNSRLDLLWSKLNKAYEEADYDRL
jgi:hypothetical protein